MAKKAEVQSTSIDERSMVKLEDVGKIYHVGETEVKALRGSNLSVKRGEFVAIMGPSGSGKSTLMNIAGALDVPTSGYVEISGREIPELSEEELALFRSKRVGFIFQTFNLMSTMTALDNVALPMMIQGIDEDERAERAMELLEEVGLEDRADHLPSELSGGEKQRVAIARSLANDPDIILADEPTGEIDSKTGEKIMKLLKKLNGEGKTVIMVTHDPVDAEYADRTVEIKDGITRPEGKNKRSDEK